MTDLKEKNISLVKMKSEKCLLQLPSKWECKLSIVLCLATVNSVHLWLLEKFTSVGGF